MFSSAMRHWATIELKRWLKALWNDGKYSDNMRYSLLKLLRMKIRRIGSEVTASAESIERMSAAVPTSWFLFDARAFRKHLVLRFFRLGIDSCLSLLDIHLDNHLWCVFVSRTNPFSSLTDAALLEDPASWVSWINPGLSRSSWKRRF